MKSMNFSSAQSFLVIGDIDPDEIKAQMKVSPGDDQILAGEDVKIEDLRVLMRWLHLKPLSDGVKLAIITNADKITAEAANTLLKTLEEPPEYAKIILTTRDEQKILPTIQSRCQKIRSMLDPAKGLTDEYLAPDELHAMSVKDKFAWAAKTAELTALEITDILTAWQIYFRKMLLEGDNQINTLNQIWRAKQLTATNTSVKLLLENLTLQM